MKREDVQKLADLARLSMTDEQCDSYLDSFESILSYIDTLNAVNPDTVEETHMTKNVVREDDDAYEAGFFTQNIINEAPHQEKGYVKVDKIL